MGNVWTGREDLGRRLADYCGFAHANFGALLRGKCNQDEQFRSIWKPEMAKAELLPDELVRELIGPAVTHAAKHKTKLAVTDIAKEAQLKWVLDQLGMRSMQGVVGVFYITDPDICIQRGLAAGYDRSYVERRIRNHGQLLRELEPYLRVHVDYVIEVDGSKTKDEIWDTVINELASSTVAA